MNLFKVKFEDIQIVKMMYDKLFYILNTIWHQHIIILWKYLKIKWPFRFFLIRVAGQNTCVQRLAVWDLDNRAYLSKVTKVVVNIYPWDMFQIDVFYDGIGGHKDYETTACDSDFTKRSLIQLWFLLADD